MKWFTKCIKNYATFTGRARRAEYWYFVLFAMLLALAAMVIDQFVFGKPSVCYYGLFLFLFIPSLAVMVRRLHDTERSGKLVLWYYVAYFVWIILLVVTGFSVLVGLINGSVPDMPIAFIISLIVGGLGSFAWAILFLVWLCAKGTPGDNKYGPDPLTVEE